MAPHAALRPLLRHSPFPLPSIRPYSTYGYEQSKCLVLSQFGEPKDVLSLHSHSISPPHSSLVTLRFLASPINPADINQIQGVYPTKPTFTTSLGTSDPIAVGGNEGVAEVLSVGSSVKSLKKGDWVLPRKQGFGTWRTHAQTTSEDLLRLPLEKLPSKVTPQQAGTVSVNPCTAYRLLKDFATLNPERGDWFIQNGANSGVGRAAIQLGKLWGYKSLNIIRDREGVEDLKSELENLGADLVVTEKELEDRGFRDKFKEVAGGGREGIKLGLNCVGGKLVNSMAKFLAGGATMVTYGAMSKQPVQLPMGLQIFKDVGFRGFWVSRWSERNPGEKEACVEEILGLMAEGKLRDVPLRTVKWERGTEREELVEAVQGTLEGFRGGKGIFVFGEG